MFFAKASRGHAPHTILKVAVETDAWQKDPGALPFELFSYWKDVDLACAEPIAHTRMTGAL